jgi:hypothetical protein
VVLWSSSSEADVDTRQAYVAWCQYYGKTPSDERFSIFATNFLTQWNYDQQQQRPTSIASVNEFADWTAEEFQQGQLAVEAKIQEIYQQWCLDYGKPALPGTRYETFKANFLQNMKYYEQTGDFYQLNQYADLTHDEYQALSEEDQATATAATNESEDRVRGPSSSNSQPYCRYFSHSYNIIRFLLEYSLLLGCGSTLVFARHGSSGRPTTIFDDHQYGEWCWNVIVYRCPFVEHRCIGFQASLVPAKIVLDYHPAPPDGLVLLDSSRTWTTLESVFLPLVVTTIFL